MRAQVLFRKVHYWLSIVVALPILLVVISGLLLQVKKDFSWIQPHENKGSGGEPNVTFEQVLEICAAIPQIQVKSWDDIQRVELRPGKNLLKVTTTTDWEVQIDPADGRVMQTAIRRSDLIESLHDGSWFGSIVKRGIFLPAGIILAVLWATGIYLFLLPQLRRKRPRSPAKSSKIASALIPNLDKSAVVNAQITVADPVTTSPSPAAAPATLSPGRPG